MDCPLVAAFRHVSVKDEVRCCIQNSEPVFMFPTFSCAPPTSRRSGYVGRCSFAFSLLPADDARRVYCLCKQ